MNPIRSCFRSIPIRLSLIAFGLFVLLSFLTRLVLLIVAKHDVAWDSSLLGVFGYGLLFDAAAGIFAALPWLLISTLIPDFILKNTFGRILIGLFMVIYSGLLVFISISEGFFWDEFGARFNFIAVDYLVWTQEVFGNIRESYPMGRITAGIILAALVVTGLLYVSGLMRWALSGETTWKNRIGGALAGLSLAIATWFTVSQPNMPNFANQFNGEIAKNGSWSFFAAFKQMEIEYTTWYPTLPEQDANKRTKELLTTANETAATNSPDDLKRVITKTGEEHRWNVILICMESFSGDYMSYLGNKENLSPNLDRLANESVFFENLYATGTRTVRGMEALTLNLPPTPGQAIIYRPEGTDLVTTFTPFLKRNYDCAFFYGGDGRFDYMNRYFSTAGCRIMDVRAWEPSDTTFKTSWGSCDEDLFNKTISEADKNYAAGKPFHYFCMTTSNHRPYDFPEGRIDIPSHKRRGAVKYADWAIGDMLEKASKKPWFNNTIFVICADHCSNSAGKTELDVTKFHIPAMIYNPALVPAQKVTALSSQIDVMPTVFGLLNWSHETFGYGYDRLATPPAPERAFVSNYQKIALLRNDGLAILKPKRMTTLYDYDFTTSALTPKPEGTGQDLLHDTNAYYQSASWLFKSGKLKNPDHVKTVQP